MEWLGDYLEFCLSNGLGGLVLLALSGFVALVVIAALLSGITKAGQAFARGWNGAR
ncbi:hypothetical protein [Nocardioides terrigena]|uniref:hypothetical protein n=1 Tax=Nocardioides terrigena TaxID=424797 RepID=UPI00131F3E89|nr:hypothetical protein [Nocardioides terrigena]